MQIDKFLLTDSWTGKLTQKMSAPVLTEWLLLASVFLLWYEGLFTKIGLGLLNSYFIVPVLLVLAFLFADKSKIRISRSTIYLISFFVLLLVSGVFAAGRGISPKLIILGWLLYIQFLISMIASAGSINAGRLIKNIIIISVPMVIAGGYQFVTKQTTSALWITPVEASITTRAFAFLGSPNVLGGVLAITALLSGSLYFEKKDKFMLAVSVLSVIVLGFTFSRSAWLGFAIGFLVILLVKNWKLVILLPLVLVGLLSSQIRTRIYTVFTPTYWFDSALDGRLWSLNNGFNLLSKYPLLGTGPGTYGGQLAVHGASPVYLQGIQNGYVALYFTDNQWLQILVQTGLVGFLLFTLFAVNIFAELIVKYNKTKIWTYLGITGALVAFSVTAIFGNVLEFGAIAIPMGIILGAAQSE